VKYEEGEDALVATALSGGGVEALGVEASGLARKRYLREYGSMDWSGV